jgi:hypothetical protein
LHQALQVIARPNGRFRYWGSKASRESSFIGDGHTSKLLEFGQLAQGNHTTRTIFVSRYVVIVRAVNKETNSVFVTEANQLREGHLNGLSVFEPDNDVCIDQKFEIVHRSTTQRIPR